MQEPRARAGELRLTTLYLTASQPRPRIVEKNIMGAASSQSSTPEVALPPPPSKQPTIGAKFPCCVVHERKLYLVGGRSKHQLDVFDFVKCEWSLIVTVGAGPECFEGANAVVIGDYLYVFGGRDNLFCSSDVYQLNLLGMDFNWKKLIGENGDIPSRKFGAGMVDYDSQWLCVMAGYCGNYLPGNIKRQKGALYDFDHVRDWRCWTNELHTFHIESCEY